MITALKDMAEGQQGEIVNYEGGLNFRLKLQDLGLHKGNNIKIKRNGKFSGPVLVEVMGREIALGRGIAEKVLIEVDK